MDPEDQRTIHQEKAMNTIKYNHKNLIVAVAAALIGSAALGANAGTVNDVPTVTVKYADLNLDTQVGAVTLYKRIRFAAKQVCGDADTRRIDLYAQTKACMDRAIVSSVRAVGSPKLASEYNAHMSVDQKQINLADLR
jgi:UrcA family protein